QIRRRAHVDAGDFARARDPKPERDLATAELGDALVGIADATTKVLVELGKLAVDLAVAESLAAVAHADGLIAVGIEARDVGVVVERRTRARVLARVRVGASLGSALALALLLGLVLALGLRLELGDG